ncbi:MAG TPA: methyltransferase [Candidatus Angelobacter sp.]|nr:methyltransferase [Candidatus Angelobacter sp.]
MLEGGTATKSVLGLPPTDDGPIRDLWLSLYIFPAVSAADEIGLFGALEQSPMTIEMLAEKLSLSHPASEALVATMSGLGLLRHSRGKFELTETAKTYLVPGKPFYWGPWFRFFRDIPVTHQRMITALCKGEPAVANNGNVLTQEWESAQMSAEQAATVTRAMHSHSFAPAMGLAEKIDLSSTKNFLDIAGGAGSLCIAMAKRHPNVHFTVADLPPVCDVAREYILQYDLPRQIDVRSLDMFRDPWPTQYDAISFMNILHDWGKERRAFLVKRTFDALPPGGKIFIFELLMSDARDGSLTAGLFSVNMIYVTEGKQFTSVELQELLQECGFRDVTTTRVYAGYALVSGQKPK